MNRRKFALSWGRKIFFGVSLPVSLMIGLLYLRSYIFPESLFDWAFFLASYIGTLGLLNVVLYFVFYLPITSLMPTYYVSRLWSFFLILILNLFLFIDALSFSSFHHHLYEFLSPEIWKAGIEYLKASKIFIVVLITMILALTILFWVRGEILWRRMQGRFSNPVSNWYIVVILVCFVAGKAIYFYGPIDDWLAKVIPFHISFRPHSEFAASNDNRNFFYPSEELSCRGKRNPNVIMITIKEWGSYQLTADMMPKIFHMKEHAINYSSHMNLSQNIQAGHFSLLYSLPSSYMGLSDKADPAIKQVLRKRGYEMLDISAGPILSKFYQWLDNRSGNETKPFFISLTFSQHPFEIDSQIDELILRLENEGLLRNTEIVLTGAYSGSDAEQLPLVWFRPERKFSEVKHVTTPYDVMPTLLTELWACKNVFQTASVGVPLDQERRDWVVAHRENGFKIYDFEKNTVIHFQDNGISILGNEPRLNLIFSALKTMTKFNRP